MRYRVIMLFALTSVCGCLFGPDSKTVHYKGEIVLHCEVSDIIENECVERGISIIPFEASPEYLYLLEKPEDIDSVFRQIQYSYDWTPRIESFFPDSGMLLVFSLATACEDTYNNHNITLHGDTISIDISVEEYDVADPLPGVNSMVIPIGMIPAKE